MTAKGTLANTILQGKVDGKRSRGRPARLRLDNVKEWTELSMDEMWMEPEDGGCHGESVSVLVPQNTD